MTTQIPAPVRRALAIGTVASLAVLGACSSDDSDTEAGAGDMAADTTASTASTADSSVDTTAGDDSTDTTADDGTGADPYLEGMATATYTTADHSFDGPAELRAGLVHVTQVNDGEEDHHVQIVKLNDGVTFEEIEADLAGEDPNAAMPKVSLVGGPNGATPGGGTSQAVVELSEGDHMVICVIPSPDGVPHTAKGMFQRLSVVPADGDVEVAEPESMGTITLRDMAVVLPDDFTGEPGWYELTNEGPQPHEMVVVTLEDGKALADYMAWGADPTSGPPPGYATAGSAGFSAGGRTWVWLDLAAGNHLFTCFIPDLTDPAGLPHIAKGMVTEVSIA